MIMKKLASLPRLAIFLFIGTILVLLGTAFIPNVQNNQAATPTPTATVFISELEVGSTSGIFIGATAITLIIIIPLLWHLIGLTKKEKKN